MFCTYCGKELNANNICVNLACPCNEMRDFIGIKNTYYYMDKWAKSQYNSSFISWNWPAFIFNLVWFWFRKMYIYTIILFIIPLVALFVLPTWAYYLVNLGIAIGCGLLADKLYIKHSIKEIRDINSTAGVHPLLLSQRIKNTGGVTWVPFIILSIIGALGLICFVINIFVTAIS